MTEPQHYQQLQYDERVAIAGFRAQGLSIRAMARMLNRTASTISREVLRNAPCGKYSCTFAQKRRNRRRIFCRPAPKLVPTSNLFAQVCELLKRKWSPEQIAIYLRRQFPNDSTQRVSHETIYNAIYAMPRGELRKELIAVMRLAQAKRMPRSTGQERRGKLVDMVSIHVRPPEVNDGVFPGHWEAVQPRRRDGSP
jgi:transposase, IS30 family